MAPKYLLLTACQPLSAKGDILHPQLQTGGGRPLRGAHALTQATQGVRALYRYCYLTSYLKRFATVGRLPDDLQSCVVVAVLCGAALLCCLEI
jgi:hypothetical protein